MIAFWFSASLRNVSIDAVDPPLLFTVFTASSEDAILRLCCFAFWTFALAEVIVAMATINKITCRVIVMRIVRTTRNVFRWWPHAQASAAPDQPLRTLPASLHCPPPPH